MTKNHNGCWSTHERKSEDERFRLGGTLRSASPKPGSVKESSKSIPDRENPQTNEGWVELLTILSGLKLR